MSVCLPKKTTSNFFAKSFLSLLAAWAATEQIGRASPEHDATTPWTAVVQPNVSAVSCASQLEALQGVQVRSVIEPFGIVLLTLPSRVPTELAWPACLAAVAPESGIQNEEAVWTGSGLVGIDGDAESCALSIRAQGAQIDAVLPIIGAIIFKMPVRDLKNLINARCLEHLEIDSVLGPTGVAGITN